MKSDIDGIRKSAKTLKNGKLSLEDSFYEIKSVIEQLKDIIQNMTEEEAKLHKENYRYVKEELKSIRARINQNYIEEAKSIKKWISNKADKLEQSDNLNKNVLYTDTITLSSSLITTGIQASNIQSIGFENERLNNICDEIMETSGAEKYFTRAQVETALSKIVVCSSDEEFEQMYKESGLQDDINNLESFTYNGKIYVKPDADDNVLKYEVNRDLAAQKRQQGRDNNNLTNTVTTPTQSFNRAMAEYVTRLNNGFLVVDEDSKEKINWEDPKFAERQEKYDDSVNFLMDLQKGLESMGFGDLVLQTGYGTKSELIAKLREITGSDTFYNSMIQSMNIISDKSNATVEEIDNAKKQLENLGKQIQNIDKRVLDGKDVYLEKGDRVYFLDTVFLNEKGVQKGSDCFILESVDKAGNTIYGMIDTGEKCTSDRVLKYMEELGIKELDFMLITHGHGDHTGGYKDIYDNVHIKNLYIKDEENNTTLNKGENNVIDYTKSENKYKPKEERTKIKYVNHGNSNKEIEFGNFTIPLFNTEDRLAGKKQKGRDNENVNTIGALAVVNGRTVHFSGDIGKYDGIDAGVQEAKEVRKYMNENDLDSITVDKMSHHGNAEVNNSQKEIDLLDPENALVTLGKKRIKGNKQKFGDSIDRIDDYINKHNGKLFYSAGGTTVFNVQEDGNYTLEQLPNHWTSKGGKVNK